MVRARTYVCAHILCMRNSCMGSSIADLEFLLRTSAALLIITADAATPSSNHDLELFFPQDHKYNYNDYLDNP